MKVDNVLKRKSVHVKAIRTYNSKFTVHSTDEIGSHNQGVVEVRGSGHPELVVDVKRNRLRGVEVDMVFHGLREIRENFNPHLKMNWKTFGHIVMSPTQALKLGNTLISHARWAEKQ